MLKMYHYTCLENIESIKANGIRRGKNPLHGQIVVSMTTNSCPKRLGLHSGTVLIEGTDPEFDIAEKNYPSLVSETEDKKRIIKMFDQTEVRIELAVPKTFSKHILTYDELFKRDAPSLIGKPLNKYTKKELKLFWAVAVHSADYPFATSHLSKEQADLEIAAIAKGKRSHRALEWRFSTVPIPPEFIQNIEFKQSDCSYAV